MYRNASALQEQKDSGANSVNAQAEQYGRDEPRQIAPDLWIAIPLPSGESASVD
jgi:hypothetical protein